VVTAEHGPQGSRLIAKVIEDAAAVFESAHLALDFVGSTFEKQAGEYFGRRIICGNERSGASPGETTRALARQRKAGKARLCPDVIGGDLIERNRVAKAGSPGSGNSGEKTGRSLVRKTRAHARMRQTGDDREVV